MVDTRPDQSSPARLKPVDVTVASFLALLLFGIYMLTFDGTMHSTDGLSMLAVAENTVKHGNLDTRQLENWENVYLGHDGLPYTNFAVGPTLFMIPLLMLALALPHVGIVQTVMLLMPLSSALSGIYIYLSSRRLGYGPLVGLATSLLAGVGTMAWLRTRDLVADPLILLSFSASFYFALAYRQDKKLSQAALLGLALSITVLHKMINITAVPLFFAYAFIPNLALKELRRHGRLTLRNFNWPAIVTATLTGSTGLIIIGFYNAARFGNPLDTGYPNLFTTPFWIGFLGYIISPYKSIFLYVPLFILIPFTIKKTWQRHPPELILIITLLLSQMLIFGAWYDWGGGRNWGPRFLVPLNGLLLLLLLPTIAKALQPRQRRARATLTLFATISIFVQILGISARDDAFLGAADYWTPPPHLSYFGELNWNRPGQWPIWGHLLRFDPREIPLIWHWRWAGIAHFEPITLAAALLMAVLGLAGLIFALKGRRYSLPAWWSGGAWLAGLVCVALILGRNTDDPRSLKRADEADKLWPAYSALVRQLPALVGPTDAVVFTDRRFEYYLFDQDKSQAQRYVVAKDTQPIILKTVPQLLKAQAGQGRVWLVTDPLDNRQLAYAVELWLNRQGRPVEQHLFDNGVQLTAFKLPPSTNWPAFSPKPDLQAVVDPQKTKFNGIAALLGWHWPTLETSEPPQLVAGQDYPFELYWIYDGKAPDDHFFVRLLNPTGQPVLAQSTRPRPNSRLTPGNLLVEDAVIHVPHNLPTGVYRLQIGFTIPVVAEKELTFSLPASLTKIQVVSPRG